MDIHYNKHYRGYVDKLNKALSKKDYGDVELENIVKSISRYNKEIRNNAGGAFNHALFWKMLSPKKQEVNGKILDKINRKYGTFNEFKKKFESIAQKRFGSGWVWVVLTRSENIKIVSTPNQDNPLMNIIKNGGFPILGLDLWEHSYYLKYQNKRDEYIKNFWDYVNWEFVNSLIDKKTKKKPLTETIDKKNIILEDKFEGCTKDDIFAIRSVFNMNGEVVKIFREWIDFTSCVFKQKGSVLTPLKGLKW
jgi:Fe-Mn family superoxide dismutase